MSADTFFKYLRAVVLRRTIWTYINKIERILKKTLIKVAVFVYSVGSKQDEHDKSMEVHYNRKTNQPVDGHHG